jgi:hypothetical protein
MSERGLARRGALLALVAYFAIAVLLFGRDTVGDPAHVVEGFGPAGYFGRDQSFYVWSLAWLAHSLRHVDHLVVSHTVFVPTGYNLTWAASVLGPALIVAPLTFLAGPVVSFNVLALSAPAGAAFTTFLLCRHVTGSSAASFAGGLLFGFGIFESVEMVNHLNLALIGLLPLGALVVLRRHTRRVSRRRFLGEFAVLLTVQLWTSSELLACFVLAGSLALAVAWLVGLARLRELAVTAGECAAGIALAAVLSTPFLYYAARYPNPISGVTGANNGDDLMNLLVPTGATWLHGPPSVVAHAARFRGNITEQLGYVGIPVVILVGASVIECHRSALARFFGVFGAASLLASLGSSLVVDGRDTGILLPWRLAAHMPLLRFIVPGRLVVFLWLAIAVGAGCWLARRSRRGARWTLAALAVISVLPNQDGPPWGTRVDVPKLFSATSLSTYVPRNSVVLALPFGIAGDSMFWQQQADFRFRLAGGYVSVSLPAAYHRYIHLIRALEGGTVSRTANAQLCEFVGYTKTDIILVRDHAPGAWSQLLMPLGVQPQHRGGFAIYTLRPSRGLRSPCRA